MNSKFDRAVAALHQWLGAIDETNNCVCSLKFVITTGRGKQTDVTIESNMVLDIPDMQLGTGVVEQKPS